MNGGGVFFNDHPQEHATRAADLRLANPSSFVGGDNLSWIPNCGRYVCALDSAPTHFKLGKAANQNWFVRHMRLFA